MHRFYRLDVQPDLFGGVLLMKEWGRKPKLTPHQRKEILRRRADGEAVREIARSYNVHNSTISRLTI
jgi:DNA invertase Pin-like site-specific DNA recombinase